MVPGEITWRKSVSPIKLSAAPNARLPVEKAASDHRSSGATRDVVWLSTARAAARAGVCTRTLKRWIAAGYLQANRPQSPKGKGHLRIRVGDLEAFIGRGAVA
jgi:hypothetical protein